MKVTAILASLFASLSLASAATTKIAADADTTVHESFPANNFGARATLQAGATTGASARTRALVRFNVAAAVPPGATILAARLTLTATDAPPVAQTTQPFEIRRLVRPWREGAQSAAAGGPAAVNDATWSHRLYPNTVWAAAGTDIAAGASAEVAVGAVGSYRIDSTALLIADVQGWLDTPENNYGWAVLGKNESAAQTAR
ncbi:MAG: DNRLRE domain-containing protein, partial [Chthoniobacteraceae bacterium]